MRLLMELNPLHVKQPQEHMWKGVTISQLTKEEAIECINYLAKQNESPQNASRVLTTLPRNGGI